jgi:hypothetical protein
MKHTPGPWKVLPGVIGGERCVWLPNTEIPVAIRASEADARLIAASPEMLGALKYAAEVLRNTGLEGRDEENAALERIDAVIAKAEGTKDE